MLHVDTLFFETRHWSGGRGRLMCAVLVLSGTLFVYFVNPSARRRGLVQLFLLLLMLAVLFAAKFSVAKS
ncbi:MAG: hypothetical protein Q4A49_02755 [Neisseria sp.]|nr:hypothetical protein [Neisseria sp.]